MSHSAFLFRPISLLDLTASAGLIYATRAYR
jgi:hypothetical protein